jgi:hypothetical protein
VLKVVAGVVTKLEMEATTVASDENDTFEMSLVVELTAAYPHSLAECVCNWMRDREMARVPVVSKLGQRLSYCADSRAGLAFYPIGIGTSGFWRVGIKD